MTEVAERHPLNRRARGQGSGRPDLNSVGALLGRYRALAGQVRKHGSHPFLSGRDFLGADRTRYCAILVAHGTDIETVADSFQSDRLPMVHARTIGQASTLTDALAQANAHTESLLARSDLDLDPDQPGRPPHPLSIEYAHRILARGV